jgi:AraC-like DNA-binding protein
MTKPLPIDQIFIRKLIEIIIANLGNESFGAKELAQESGLSLYNLKRKLLAATQKSVSQFISTPLFMSFSAIHPGRLRKEARRSRMKI